MRYRVEQLAAACDVSVDTVRYYQSRALLPPPTREGRVAWYGREHAERIRRIRALQRQGLTLAVIRRVLDGTLRRSDRDLASAVASARNEEDEELLTREELAARSGVPAAVLLAVEREGLPLSRRIDGEPRYTASDVELVRIALSLLEKGFPLGELLRLARTHDEAMRPVVEASVELFDRHVRKPIHDSAASDDEAAARLVDAFRELLPIVSTLVAHHFRRVLLAAAEEHLERVGNPIEVQAARRESRRRLEALP